MAQASLDDLDPDDRRIVSAGLIFDELLSRIRAHKPIRTLNLRPECLARAAVAIANFSHRYIEGQLPAPSSDREAAPLAISDIQQVYIEAGGVGEGFQPDEMFTGVGDGLRYLLTDILGNVAKSDLAGMRDSVTDEDFRVTVGELKKAIEYHVLVDYWHDCVANDFEITISGDSLVLTPMNPELEISRIASSYRRLSLALQGFTSFLRWWKFELTRAQKERLYGIRLVTDLALAAGAVERIRTGRSHRVVERQSSSVEALLQIQLGPYAFLLEQPLPKLDGLTLAQLIKGWQFAQSLAAELHARAHDLDERRESILALAPVIRGRVLLPTLANALGIDRPLATRILEALTYSARRLQDLWAQPLVACGEDFLLVIPCVLAVHFRRIVETWMRQGGLNLDERGPEFEKYCRDELLLSLEDSPIRRSVQISARPVRFTTSRGVEEEIDLAIVLHDVVLLIEAKCILWPDEAAHFANYRATVEKATEQIERKRLAARENLESFSKALTSAGCGVPAKAHILACVLTNSAVYAGFLLREVPIIDLDILRVFLSGKHIDWQIWERDVVVDERIAVLYNGAEEAARNIEAFITDPPQLRRIKANTAPRRVIQSLSDSRFRTLTMSTYKVDIDSQAQMKRARESA